VWESDHTSEGKSPHLANPDGGHWWVRIHPNSPPARVGGLTLREFRLPLGTAIHLGDTVLLLDKAQAQETKRHALPETPGQVRPWLTRSESGRELLWSARKLAETRLSVYINGETGTGKELIAHLLHAWSPRRSGPFVPINCAALSISLVESELFGHVRGAYTGAEQSRRGALLQANQGTLFLDEVGDLPMEVQIKLLRFLESGEIRPVGADHSVRSDVRIVCATHLPLKKLVEEGRFRRDLYFRLASVTLALPSLRTRPEDIRYLSQSFASDNGKTLSPGAIALLQSCQWKGNARELRHAVDRASALSGLDFPVLSEKNFNWLQEDETVSENPGIVLDRPNAEGALDGCVSLADMERTMVLRALKICNGNRTDAARRLGIARSTLALKIRALKIPGTRPTKGTRTNLLQLNAIRGLE
jgi:DNA-binding NtrC family response regulator